MTPIVSSRNLTLACTTIASPNQIRFRIQASDGAVTGDLVEGGIDEVSFSVPLCNVCTTGPANPPGQVLNNLLVAKSPTGSLLDLTWTAVAGTCDTTTYGVYRGNLPWAGYNHASLTCTTGGTTSYSTPQDTGSYYFLVVPQNGTNEGAYGLDSSGAQIPAASTPCLTQNLTACN